MPFNSMPFFDRDSSFEGGKMNCPHCHTRMGCYDSRLHPGNIRIRRYECPECGYKDKTSEQLEKPAV